MSRRSIWMAVLLVGILAVRSFEADRPTTAPPPWSTCSSPSAHEVPGGREVAAPVGVALERWVDLPQPTAAAPLDDGSVLVTLKEEGVVRVDPDGAVTPVLDLTDDLAFDSERGVLGIAVEPGEGAAFVAYTAADGAFTVERFALPSVEAVPPRETILTYPDPHRFHNGGHLAFGPDAMLFVSLGDGGDEGYLGDPEDDAQALDSLFGKILRIDVTSDPGEYTVPADNPFVGLDDARPEIWAYGMRNPWRFTFDTDTDDLWIADVGHFCWEEVNRIPADRAGANFGWNRYEGGDEFRTEYGEVDDLVWPVYQYAHTPTDRALPDGVRPACAIVGGVVYRGAALPDLDGWYVYSDYCSHALYAVDPVDGDTLPVSVLAETEAPIVAVATDREGELLVLTTDGLLRVVAGDTE